MYPEKRSQTDAKIEELIGLSKEQFTQTAMIAQGDFLKLLYAKSDDRKKIFSKLFHTDAYWRIQENLKRRSFEMDRVLAENEQGCRAGEGARDSAARRTERTSGFRKRWSRSVLGRRS